MNEMRVERKEFRFEQGYGNNVAKSVQTVESLLLRYLFRDKSRAGR